MLSVFHRMRLVTAREFMYPRQYFFLSVIALIIGVLVGVFQKTPGYMDADYYFAGGKAIAEGDGFYNNFLWNYLDDPEGIPHPSHTYWMPLASLISALGMRLTGNLEFASAKIGFLLLVGTIPAITAAIAYSLTKKRTLAIMSGLMAILPVYYLPFLTTTDTFGIYMVLGGLFFLIVKIWIGVEKHQLRADLCLSLLLGIIVGMMHLSRADGVIWLVTGIIFMIYKVKRHPRELNASVHVGINVILLIIGYLLIVGPWMVRNLNLFDNLFSPGSTRTLWLTNYDELYSYPPSVLTYSHWWNSGFGEIIKARISAIGINIIRAFVEQGGIVLAPLILLGLWQLRSELIVRLGGISWLLSFIVMSIIFPFSGVRGGFFHSGAALQPLFWAVAPVGLWTFIKWGEQMRGWQPHQAWRFFSFGLVGLLCILTLLRVNQQVIKFSNGQNIWNSSAREYSSLDKALRSNGATQQEVVLINNPPGYYVITRRPAIAIPNDGISTLIEVGKRYQAQYVLLEINHPSGLDDLYSDPRDRNGLRYLGSKNGTRIYLINHQETASD